MVKYHTFVKGAGNLILHVTSIGGLYPRRKAKKDLIKH